MIAPEQPRGLLLYEAGPGTAQARPPARRRLARYLSNQGYQVTSATGESELMRLVGQPEFALALLDAGAHPDHLLGAVGGARSGLRRGVILLSDHDDLQSRVAALEAGADDYLVKPVEQAELLARIQAVLRRYQGGRAHSTLAARASWRLFPEERRLMPPDGRATVQLSQRECQLLTLLAEHQGGAVSRDVISQAVMGREWLPGDRAIDVLVRRVRSKLDSVGGHRLLNTERHVGYSVTGIQVGH